MRVSYRTGILGWDYDLNPYCPKPDMQLVPSTGNGGIIFDHPKLCLVPFIVDSIIMNHLLFTCIGRLFLLEQI